MITDIGDADDEIIMQGDKLAPATGHVSRNAPVCVGLLRKYRKKAWHERKRGDRRYRIWLIVDDGELAGIASVSPEGDGWRFGVWIREEFRGRGHADRLFAVASSQYAPIYADRAREYYYDHLGFEEVKMAGKQTYRFAG